MSKTYSFGDLGKQRPTFHELPASNMGKATELADFMRWMEGEIWRVFLGVTRDSQPP